MSWLSCFSPVSLAGGLLCCSPSTISAQELQAKITINHAQISGTEKGVFDNLQQTLQQFVNNRQWTHLQFQKNERIICNFNITVTKYDRDQNLFTCKALIQANRPLSFWALSYENLQSSKDIRSCTSLLGRW